MEHIQSLTAEQAQRALLLFYDLLPDDLWSGQKPSWADVEAQAEELQEEGPPETRSFIAGLAEEQNTSRQGEIAKILLSRFAQHQQLEPYVQTAITRAAEPHMMLMETTLLISFLAVAAGLKFENGQLSYDGQRVVELVKALPGGLFDSPGKNA